MSYPKKKIGAKPAKYEKWLQLIDLKPPFFAQRTEVNEENLKLLREKEIDLKSTSLER